MTEFFLFEAFQPRVEREVKREVTSLCAPIQTEQCLNQSVMAAWKWWTAALYLTLYPVIHWQSIGLLAHDWASTAPFVSGRLCCVSVSSSYVRCRYSGFFPQSKDTTGYSNLSVGVIARMNGCFSAGTGSSPPWPRVCMCDCRQRKRSSKQYGAMLNVRVKYKLQDLGLPLDREIGP